MKKIVWVFVVMFFLFGCEESSTIEDYGDTVTEAYGRAGNITDKANLQAAKKNIQSYRANNGKYPGSIEEVADFMGGSFDVDKYDYDPATGKIDLK